MTVKDLVVAYEPVWSIGTGKNASTEIAQDICGFIREVLRELFGEVADEIRVLYGGSVKPENVKAYLSCPDVDGALVGGASLKIDSYESLLVNIALWVLSGSLFGFIWQYMVISSVDKFDKVKCKTLHYILGILLFPYFGVTSYIINKKIVNKLREKGHKVKDLSILYLILGLCGLNIISLIIMQKQLNTLLKDL